MFKYKSFNIRPDKNLKISDCAIRSLAFASGRAYREILKLFKREEEYDLALEMDDPDIFNGVTFDEFKAGLKKLPVKPKLVPAVRDGKIFSVDAWMRATEKHPDWTFVFCVQSKSGAVKHVTSCRNGTIYDNWSEQVFRNMNFRIFYIVVFQNA